MTNAKCPYYRHCAHDLFFTCSFCCMQLHLSVVNNHLARLIYHFAMKYKRSSMLYQLEFSSFQLLSFLICIYDQRKLEFCVFIHRRVLTVPELVAPDSTLITTISWYCIFKIRPYGQISGWIATGIVTTRHYHIQRGITDCGCRQIAVSKVCSSIMDRLLSIYNIS